MKLGTKHMKMNDYSLYAGLSQLDSHLVHRWLQDLIPSAPTLDIAQHIIACKAGESTEQVLSKGFSVAFFVERDNDRVHKISEQGRPELFGFTYKDGKVLVNEMFVHDVILNYHTLGICTILEFDSVNVIENLSKYHKEWSW